MKAGTLLTKQSLEGINMHMTVSRPLYLSISTLSANNARGTGCMGMCACMENLTLRDTF
jgi:hypothetical protein